MLKLCEFNNGAQIERAKYVYRAFGAGLDKQQIIGYHGTSIEALVFLIKEGYLPGGINKELYKQGPVLFIAPVENIEHPLARKLKWSTMNGTPTEYATGYAGDIAQKHFLLSSLGLPLGDPQLDNQMLEIMHYNNHFGGELESNEEVIRLQREFGIPAKLMAQRTREAIKRKGVLLEVSSSALSDFKVVIGDDIADLGLVCPNGIDFAYFCGFKPLGDFEHECFEVLQKELES